MVGRAALLWKSRLAPLELGFGAWFFFRGLTLRLDPRLTARGRSLTSRLGPRWRGGSTPAPLRNGSALRLRRRPGGVVGPVWAGGRGCRVGAPPPPGAAGVGPAARVVRPVP